MSLMFLKMMSCFFAALPLRMALSLGRGMGAAFECFVARGRRRADEHLAACFPEKSASDRHRIRRQMFAHLGMNTVEIFRWMGGRTDELRARIECSSIPIAEAAAARGKGVLALVAHIGNFDLMGLWAAGKIPLTIISKELKNEALNQFWMKKRAEAGLNIVPAHNSYRDCLRVLKRGEFLGFILDQNMTRDEGIFVEFFGRPACTTPGLAMLSAHSGAPVMPVFMVRRADGRHEVFVRPPMDPPPDRTPESLAAATQAYTRVVEEMVRAHPEQWIWMHRRWRTQPLPPKQEEK